MISPGLDEDLQRAALAEIDRLLDKSRAERAEMLHSLAHSSPDLHELVTSLLRHEDTVGQGFMEPGTIASSRGDLNPDSRLGPYRIIRLLGEGGMGEVWLASRDDGLYEGQVAIKTLHPFFAGGVLRERFRREAKVLGRLAHSNIARLLDAGIHGGVVYLVLEYVVGRPVDVACDEEKLDIAARLRIFQQLCAAVAHAHSMLVVHRDIKPANVLLTADGVPKLLDFGIASFYEPEKDGPKTALTRLSGRIFTPEYAAPEQVLGGETTTAADVYSLGVLLYVLLTGQLPYQPAHAGPTSWEQAVLHQEPQRLVRAVDAAGEDAAAKRSTPLAKLRRELSGDLESIVQQALRKRPEDRYQTVAAFADDIRRCLGGEPVLARADSAWYRIAKFAQRNRLAVGSTAAVVAALGMGLAVSLWQLQVAREERRRAEEVKEFVASIFRAADPRNAGKDSVSAADLLSVARQRIDRELGGQPRNAVELLTLVGESQLNLHQRLAATETLAKAAKIAESVEPRDDVLVAEARARLAVIAGEGGDWAQLRTLAAQALPDLRKHQPGTGRMLSELLLYLSYAEADEGSFGAGIALVREAVAAASAALGSTPLDVTSKRHTLCAYLSGAGQFEEARRVCEQVLRDAQALEPSVERGTLVIRAEARYATLLLDLGERQAAVSHFKAAVDLAAQLYGPDNPSRYTVLGDLARAQSRLGDFKGLLVTLRMAAEDQEPGLIQARTLTNYARTTLAAGKVADSLDLLRRAVELEKQFDTGKGTVLVLAQADFAAALALSGRFDEADRLLQATLPLNGELPQEGSLASTWNSIGLSRQLQSKWAESEQAFREALGNTNASDPYQRFRAEAQQGIGMARLELGQAADAENWLRQADESIRKTFLGMTPLRAEITMNLGRSLLAQGKIAAAVESFAAANAYWLDYDPSNRVAARAAYWLAQGQAQQRMARL